MSILSSVRNWASREKDELEEKYLRPTASRILSSPLSQKLKNINLPQRRVQNFARPTLVAPKLPSIGQMNAKLNTWVGNTADRAYGGSQKLGDFFGRTADRSLAASRRLDRAVQNPIKRYFAPTTKTRIRDVAREMPGTAQRGIQAVFGKRLQPWQENQKQWEISRQMKGINPLKNKAEYGRLSSLYSQAGGQEYQKHQEEQKRQMFDLVTGTVGESGNVARKAFRSIAKTQSAKEIFNILKKTLRISEKDALAAAKKLAPIDSAREVEALVSKLPKSKVFQTFRDVAGQSQKEKLKKLGDLFGEKKGEKTINKYFKNAYQVATDQKQEALVGKLRKEFGLPNDTPDQVFLRAEAYKEILKKHPDKRNVDFNKALKFVRTINFPNSVKQLSKENRINLLKQYSDDFLNNVGTKPITKDGKTFVNTSFITNQQKEAQRLLSGGRPIPPSPIGVGGRIAHLDNSLKAPSSNTLAQKPSFSQGVEPPFRGDEFKKKLNIIGEKEPIIENSAVNFEKEFSQKTEGKLDPNTINVANYSNILSKLGISKKAAESLGFRWGKEKILEILGKNPEFNAKKTIYEKFIAGLNKAEDLGIEKGLALVKKFKNMNPKAAEDIIKYLDSDRLAPENIKLEVDYFRQMYGKLYQQAKESGLDFGFWDNYITHIWRESEKQIGKKIKTALKRGIITEKDLIRNPGGAGQYVRVYEKNPGALYHLSETNKPVGDVFQFANKRIIPSYEIGERIGLHKKFNHPAQIMAHYVKTLEKAKAAVNLFKELRAKNLVSEVPVAGMEEAVNIRGFDRTFYADRKFAQQIRNAENLPNEEYYTTFMGRLLGGVANASRTLKEMLMSGGVPASPINSYGIGMTLKEIATGSPKRIWAAASAFGRSFSPQSSTKFFRENLGQIKKIKDRDIQLSTMLDNGGFLDKGFWKNIVGEWGGHWDKIMNEPTFKRFLPMNQIKLFNSIEKRLLKKGYGAKEAADIAAKELKDAMGLGSAAKEAAKSKLWKDWRETLFFAPTHRTNMIRVFRNALMSIPKAGINVAKGKMPFAPGNQTGAQFIVGGMLTYALYDFINFKNTGRHMFDNPEGTELEAYIKLSNGEYVSIPFMPTVATMPRLGWKVGNQLAQGDIEDSAKSAWQGSGSLLTKPLADIGMNEDYFGNEIYDQEMDTTGDTLKKSGKYLATQFSGHPWLKAAQATEKGNEAFSKIGLGEEDFQPKSKFQIASQAVESPLRFRGTENKIASRQFWDEYFDNKPVEEKFYKLRANKQDQSAALEYYKENQDKIDRYMQMKPYVDAYYSMGGKTGGDKALGALASGAKPKSRTISEFFSGKDQLALTDVSGLKSAQVESANLGGDLDIYSGMYGYEKLFEKPPSDALSRAEWENDRETKIKALAKDTRLPDDIKLQMIQKAGFTKEDVQLMRIGSLGTNEEKAPFLYQEIFDAPKEKRNEYFKKMIDKGMITTGAKSPINYWYAQGLINDRLRQQLLDQVKKRQSQTKVGGSSKKGKKINIPDFSAPKYSKAPEYGKTEINIRPRSGGGGIRGNLTLGELIKGAKVKPLDFS